MPAVLWPLADHLGSVRDLVDSGGVIREHLVYDGFGNRLTKSDFDAAAKIGHEEFPSVMGPSGMEYQIEIQVRWDHKSDVRAMGVAARRASSRRWSLHPAGRSLRQ